MRVSQDGFTIVELMIALGIALIIVLGLYAFLVDTQRSYLNVASNDQNNRRSKNAVTVTRNFLQQAGFVNYLNARASIGLGNAADPKRCNGKSWDKVCIESTGDQSEIYVRYYGSSNKDSYPVGKTAGPTLVSSGGDPDERSTLTKMITTFTARSLRTSARTAATLRSSTTGPTWSSATSRSLRRSRCLHAQSRPAAAQQASAPLSRLIRSATGRR